VKKRCTQCKRLKVLDEFYLIHHGKHRMSECKKCYNKRIKQYKADNSEEIKKRKHASYIKDPKRWSENVKRWQTEHAELMCVRAKIFYFKKKLRDEFSIIVNLITRKRTLEQLNKTHMQLKKMYQMRKK
jgi:NAD-dependent SIR2 family protein deacetylase